jgi:hypothetical protein
MPTYHSTVMSTNFSSHSAAERSAKYCAHVCSFVAAILVSYSDTKCATIGPADCSAFEPTDVFSEYPAIFIADFATYCNSFWATFIASLRKA